MARKNKLRLIILLFTITRLYIWVAKPTEFTQIVAVYMPYAHLWDSGETPYLEQWYEYPPATIPLFYLPHLIDKWSYGHPLHMNYAVVYRGFMLMADVGLFVLIYMVLKKFRVKYEVMSGALVFYSLATAKAHDFVYDSMDLVFVGAVVLGIASPILWKGFCARLMEWLGYFLAIGLKLVNAPLGLVYAALARKQWKRHLPAFVLAGVLVWAAPLVYFRSSLSVMWVYHSMRGLQIESVPAQIVAVVDKVTHSESVVNKYQSMNIVGPVSEMVNGVFSKLFLIAIFVFVMWGVYVTYKTKSKNHHKMRIAVTIGFVFCFMLFAKVLSTPYHLWYMPLLAIYPFKSLKEQLLFTVPALIMVILSMTRIPNLQVGVLTVHLWIGLIRAVIIGYMLVKSVKLIRDNYRLSV